MTLTHDDGRVPRVGKNGDRLRIGDSIDATKLDINPVTDQDIKTKISVFGD